MVNQVLSVKQMQELIELGFDTSKASMCWVATGRTDYTKELPQIREMTLQVFTDIRKDIWLNKETYRPDDIIPTFTLQDILEMLPSHINFEEEKDCYLSLIKAFDWRVMAYCSENKGTLLELQGNTDLEAAFNMLKWCKQNNYI